MKIQLEITKNFTIAINPFYWFLFPNRVTYLSTHHYRWACFRIMITEKTNSEKPWSDDEIVKQMTDLEKEIESQKKTKKKSVVKVKRSK